MVKIINNIKQSWQAYRKFFLVIISAILIAAIPPAFVTGMGFLVASDFSVSQASYLIQDTYFSQSQNAWDETALSPQLDTGWFLGFVLVSALMSLYFLAGTYGVCLGAIKGKTSLKLFFESLNTRGVSLVTSKLLVGLIFAGIFSIMLIIGIIFSVAVGFIAGEYSAASAAFLYIMILCLLIAVVIAPFFTLVSPSVVSGKGAVNAVKESISLGRKNYWDILGLIIIILGMLIVSFSISYLNGILGAIFSFAFVSPMIALMLSSFYLEKSFRKNTAEELSTRKKNLEKLKPIKRNSAVKKKSK